MVHPLIYTRHYQSMAITVIVLAILLEYSAIKILTTVVIIINVIMEESVSKIFRDILAVVNYSVIAKMQKIRMGCLMPVSTVNTLGQ